MPRKFEHGQIVMTKSISDKMQDNNFAGFVYNSLVRHLNCDWGDLSEEDWDCNERACVNNNDRLFSVYIDKKSNTKIWIITEYDHSFTTILFSIGLLRRFFFVDYINIYWDDLTEDKQKEWKLRRCADSYDLCSRGGRSG